MALSENLCLKKSKERAVVVTGKGGEFEGDPFKENKLRNTCSNINATVKKLTEGGEIKAARKMV